MNMYEIRFHGRGGQGAVMAAQTIAEAAILEGKQAQAFPFFGAERRGAPVMAFARIDDKRICDRTQVSEPDMLVVMDESLLEIEPVAAGLKKGGCAVVNSALAPSEIDLGVVARCVSVDATSIALEMLKAPIVNTSILGAMARADDFVKLESIQQAIMNRFGEKLGEKDVRPSLPASPFRGEAGREGRTSELGGGQGRLRSLCVGDVQGRTEDTEEERLAAHLAGDAAWRGLAEDHQGRDGRRTGKHDPEPHRQLGRLHSVVR